MIQKVQETNIDDFSGGQITVGSPFNLKEDTTPACINTYADRFGSLRRRGGITKVNSSAASDNTAYGLFDYEVSAGVHKQIAQVSTVIYKMDALDGTFDSLKTGMTAARFHAVNFNNTLLITNGTDTVQSWDGAAASTSDVAAAPTGTRMAVWYNYVWMLGQDANNIRYSNAADHTTWDAADTWGIHSYRGDKLYGFALLRRLMFAFKKYGIFKISYLGGYPLLDVQQVDSDTGCYSPDTIQNVNWAGKKGLMFLGSDKAVYFFDGYNAPIPVSAPIELDNDEATITMAKIYTDLSNASAINYPDKNWYILFLPLLATADGTIEVAICFDYSKTPMAIWPMNNMNASASSIILDTTDNSQKAMFMDYHGYLQRMEHGTTDNATAITANWASKHISRGSKFALKQERTAKIIAEDTGNYDLTLEYRSNWKTSWGSKTVNLQAEGSELTMTKDMDIPVLSNHIQYRVGSITDQPNWQVYSLASNFKSQGVGVSE